jgi:hypothetical protein
MLRMPSLTLLEPNTFTTREGNHPGALIPRNSTKKPQTPTNSGDFGADAIKIFAYYEI